jgi:ABC-type Fe3+/spermidine/putrescine transport system ATPase subunit
LLRVIADLEQASEGKIAVNGMSPDAARKARAYGYVFQAPALFPWRTGAQCDFRSKRWIPRSAAGSRPTRSSTSGLSANSWQFGRHAARVGRRSSPIKAFDGHFRRAR